jgi:hypothetical protein
MLLVQIEAVFRCFKNDLGIRPIYHQNDARVETHIFVCFQAYCLWAPPKKKDPVSKVRLKPGLQTGSVSNPANINLRTPSSVFSD